MPLREVWFQRTMIRGFDAIHWKGQILDAAIGVIVTVVVLFTLANVARSIAAFVGFMVAVGTLFLGSYLRHIHTGVGSE
jgi:uncharacterized membrane protein YkgB